MQALAAGRMPGVASWLVLALGLLLAPLALAQNWEHSTDGLAPVPPLAARVTDLTATLAPAEQQSLEAKLSAWEQKTGNQLVVLMVPSTQPEPIEAYALRVAEAWKIGRKGRDNGVLLVVAKNDRKMRLEVGYGLEGAVPDAVAKRIIAETIGPYFRQGQFGAGINAGVDRVMAAVERGEPAAPPRAAERPGGRPAAGIDFGTILVLLLVVVPILGSVLRRIFGKFIGSTLGAGIVGFGAFVVAGSLVVAIIAAIVAWFVMLVFGSGLSTASLPGGRGGGFGGGWGGGYTRGGGWGGGGGGGGGFSGGGGSFGGGGASGGW